MKLFYVMTVAPKFRGYDETVTVWWYHGDRHPGPERPYAALIKNYDPRLLEMGRYPVVDARYDARPHNQDRLMGCIDERFTEAEAEQVKAFIDANYGDHGVTTIEPMEQPDLLSDRTIPFSWLSSSRCADFYEFDECALPFKVQGFYEHQPWPIRGAQLADNADIPL